MRKIWAKTISLVIAACLLCGTLDLDVMAQGSVSTGDTYIDAISVELVRYADVKGEEDELLQPAEVPATSLTLNQTSLSLVKGKSNTLKATMTPTDTTDEVSWSSSNMKVVRVSDEGVVTAVSKGTATITAQTTSGKTATCKVTVTIPSTKIKLNRTSIAINKGKTYTLKGVLTPSNSTDTILWSSSNSKVAKVSAKGVVTAVSGGTATITAKTTSGKTGICKVTVTVPSTKIKLNKTSITLNKGKTYALKGTLNPGHSTDTITWKSSSTKVAKVSAKGVVTAVNKGTATITAKTTSGKTATCKVTVKVPATKVKLNKTSVAIYEGKTYTLKGILTPSNSTDTIKWTSSNTKVAKVSAKGVVTAVSKGTATITAKATSGKKKTCKITVKEPTINAKTKELVVNQTFTLKLNGAKAVSFISSDANVATVTSTGTVKAKNAGKTIITITDERGNKYTCNVTVKNDPYSSKQVYATMIALQKDYPEGMSWTNSNFYAWKGGIYYGGYGCAGFAFILSDAAFGDLPARKHTNFAEMKVGDILRINYDTHSVVVLEILEDSVIVAEGNYGGTIHWGREISFSDIEKTGTYVMTRYP